MVIGIGNIEGVAGLFTGGGNHGLVNTHMLLAKGNANIGQQAGAVGAGNIQHGNVLAGQLLEADSGFHIKMLVGAAFADHRCLGHQGIIFNALADALDNLLKTILISVDALIFFHHLKGIQSEAVIGGHDLGIHYIQPQLINAGSNIGKQIVVFPGVDKNLNPARVAKQGVNNAVIVLVVKNFLAVPAGFQRCVVEKIIIGKMLPQGL